MISDSNIHFLSFKKSEYPIRVFTFFFYIFLLKKFLIIN